MRIIFLDITDDNFIESRLTDLDIIEEIITVNDIFIFDWLSVIRK